MPDRDIYALETRIRKDDKEDFVGIHRLDEMRDLRMAQELSICDATYEKVYTKAQNVMLDESNKSACQ